MLVVPRDFFSRLKSSKFVTWLLTNQVSRVAVKSNYSSVEEYSASVVGIRAVTRFAGLTFE